MKLKIQVTYSTLALVLFSSSVFPEDAAISIVDGKAETTKGKINQIESEVNEALLSLQNQIDNIELIEGPQGPPGPAGPKGDTGDSGIFAVAGTSCSPGEVLTGFDESGAIICNGIAAGVIGDDCEDFRDKWLNEGNIREGEMDLRGCDLRGLSVTAFNYENTNFAGADLRGVKLEDTNLNGADFSGANLEGANLAESELMLANFTDANLSHANLRDTGWNNNTIIDRAMFTGATLEGSSFPGHIDDPFSATRPAFGNTTCPDGTNSFDDDGDGGTCNNNTLP